MRIVIVRHGETEENSRNILQGQGMGTLSARGWQQIKKLAHRLKGEHFDAIYSSDITRARQTAEEIAKHHPQTPFTITKELREVDIGSFSGRRVDEVDWSDLPSDFEHDHMLVERARKFIDSIVPKHMGQTVLCVAHGRINAALLAVLLGKPHSWIDEIAGFGNTSVNILQYQQDGMWRLDLFNDTDHLDDVVTVK